MRSPDHPPQPGPKPRRRARDPLLVAVVVGLVGLSGCTSSSTPAAAGKPSGSVRPAISGTVVVFAAASLKEAFTALGRMFEAAHPGTSVVLTFGPSSGLAQQIVQGAPADVFASASPSTMAQVTRAGDAPAAVTLARNAMEVAVPPDNPARITRLADLGRPGVKVALCQSQVPCGATAATALARAHVTVRPVTEETDVKAVLAKVQLGEVDAGVVYVTDVRAATGKVRGVVIPAAVNASTAYPIAALTRANNPAAARAFTALVTSTAGSAVLRRAGFAKP